ncbi:MAG: hypothetical protein Q4P31_00350 [Andreesenia angusta]|nr:hypothetical protein [Andreesenia angusta]
MLVDIYMNKFKCNEGYYVMVLKIPEKMLYSAYDNVDDNAIYEFVASYLSYINEEGKPRNISISKLKDNSFVVEMELIYYDLTI